MSPSLGSIKLKVLLAVVLAAGVLVAVAGQWFFVQARDQLMAAAAGQAREVLAHAGQEMVLEGRWLPLRELRRISDFHTHLRQRLRAIWALDGSGKPLLPQDPDGALLAKLAAWLEKSDKSLLSLGEGPLYAAALPVRRQGRDLGWLVGVLWLEDLHGQLALMRRGFGWLSLGGWVLLSGLLFALLHWLVVRPLENLERASAALARGEHQVRARVGGRDEIGRLGAAFNHMADTLTASLASSDQERRRLRAIIDTQSDCLFVVDAQRRLVMANQRFTELLGQSEEELIGRQCSEIMHSNLCDSGCPLFGHGQGPAGPQGVEAQLELPGGRSIPIRKYANLVRDHEGQVVGGVETFRDISHEKALAKLRAEWESFIRHELKNPLSPILALSGQLLRQDPGPQERQGHLELIHENARRLARLLELTREVQLFESGRMSLNLVDYDLTQTISQAARQAAQAVRSRPGAWQGTGEPAWRLEVPPKLDTVIAHDPEKMTRVFQNLMQNAWEHHPGEVTVRLAQPEPGWLEVKVGNQGPPIPPERLTTLFEKYNTTKAHLGGSGLGTTIAQAFSEAHGGTISAASSAQRGTELTVRLPRHHEESE